MLLFHCLFSPDACCSPSAYGLLSTWKTYSPADYCTNRGGEAVPRSQHLKTLLPTAARGSKGKEDVCHHLISLLSVLDHYLSAVSIPHPPASCILYHYFPSPVVAVSMQADYSNLASSSKPEVNHSYLGTASPKLQAQELTGYFCTLCLPTLPSYIQAWSPALVVPISSPLHAKATPTFPAWQSCTSPLLAASGAAQLFHMKDGEPDAS